MEIARIAIFCLLSNLVVCGKLQILVFGGNGFLGAETVVQLLSDQHGVTIVNRGNWYWDAEERVKPFVKLVRCDRQAELVRCEDLNQLIEEDQNIHYDFVIDFSAFYGNQISDVLHVLKGRIGKYIYISSDSVYEVCMTQQYPEGGTVEAEAVRPDDENLRRELNEGDWYGHHKLEGEEVLTSSGIPYLILRLPDVIGPRDNTYRWWIYQLWIKLSGLVDPQITIPKRLFYKPLSFVYSEDVAALVVRALYLPDSVYNNAYNLAFNEVKTLYEVLSHIRGGLKKDSYNIMLDERENFHYLFPSVTLGYVNIHKAVDKLGWKPSRFDQAVDRTIDFYEKAIVDPKFAAAKNKVISKLMDLFSETEDTIDKAISDAYNIPRTSFKEEL